MSVSSEDVLRIAKLAELDVDEEALPMLVEQMSRILGYIAQLQEVPAGETARPFASGPDALRLRPDEVRPWPLAFGPDQLAPQFRDGFFVVPKLTQFEEDDRA
ncbi:MAG TPA: Asp-tRNA(Asn)/Glu-tRNA(Gln) amidotransferase subunit GatC [Gemmatimonadales bacterium]